MVSASYKIMNYLEKIIGFGQPMNGITCEEALNLFYTDQAVCKLISGSISVLPIAERK